MRTHLKLSCDAIPTMKTALLRLRDRLGSDATYFQQVYNYAFEFSRPPGQRSLGTFSVRVNCESTY